MEDAPRSGWPKTSQETADLVLSIVTRNSITRAWSCAWIAREAAKLSKILSASSVYRILRNNNYSSCKQIVKPGLTLDIKKKRLDWCSAYEHWKLEDWKNVIFDR